MALLSTFAAGKLKPELALNRDGMFFLGCLFSEEKPTIRLSLKLILPGFILVFFTQKFFGRVPKAIRTH